MKQILYLIIALLLAVSCIKEQPKKALFVEVENPTPANTIQRIRMKSVVLDSIESFYIGFWDIYQNHILFIDKKDCHLYFFNPDGHLAARKLGQGQGPMEISTGTIDGYALLDSGGLFFVGGGNDCHLYDSDLNVLKRYSIQKGTKHDDGEPVNYDTPWIYTLSYEHLAMKNYDKYLYYTVFSEYQDMNFINSPKSYFQNAHYLCKMNLETGNVEKMLGKYPPIYDEKEELKQFSFVDFDMDANGNFYISFEGDSLIYMYDNDFYPIKTFGYAGKNMKESKRVLSTFSQFQEYYEKDRKESGFYTQLKYIRDTNLLFRSYTKGDEEKTDGLQIYKDGVLQGDIEVPKSFYVIGYIAPYYYATIDIDEKNEMIKMFRFKI